jgi:DNA-binding NtrC family response regulator
LVVEDDKNVGNVLNELMAEMNANVFLTENYQQATALIKSRNFDIILTDLGLPDKDGWGIIEFAKAANPDCFIVPMSGWNNEIDLQEIASRGLSDVLQKPFNLDQVCEILFKFQSKRKVNVRNFS